MTNEELEEIVDKIELEIEMGRENPKDIRDFVSLLLFGHTVDKLKHNEKIE
jgi:hypothetical protein